MNTQDGIIYGRNSTLEALSQDAGRISKIIISKDARDGHDNKIKKILDLCTKTCTTYQFVPKEKFRSYPDIPHQGVVAIVSPVEFTDLDDFINTPKKYGFKRIVILDGVEDPHNVGSIIRTAVCAGYDAMIVPSRRSAPINATVEKASAGAINHLPLIQVNSLSNTIEKLKNNDYWIIAADAKGKDNYYDIDYKNMNFAVVMGGEETGVSQNNLNKSDFTVKIPMLRNFNSLNVSNAASVIIYESVRQMLTM